MNNHDIPHFFLDQRLPYGSNGRGNFKFKENILVSYDNVIAWIVEPGQLLSSSDVFSATSSRHQSAIKKAAGDDYTLCPDLTALVQIAERKDEDDVKKYVFRRKAAISEYERKIETSRSENMREYLRERIKIERNAISRALRYLPFDKAIGIFSGAR